MPEPPGPELLNALLESWDRNNTVMLNLLNALPEGGLEAEATETSPTVAQQFSHIHHERLVTISEEAPEFAKPVPEQEWATEGDKARIARMLNESAEKRGSGVGKTKRGKGNKIMAISDARGTCLALHLTSASPHEVTLVQQTLATRHIQGKPEKLIGDKAYDSDSLDAELAEQGIDMTAPHRNNRKKPRTQDGRKLRRYKRRWKIEQLFAHLGNFRRLVVRYERSIDNFLGFVRLGCIKLLLRHF